MADTNKQKHRQSSKRKNAWNVKQTANTRAIKKARRIATETRRTAATAKRKADRAAKGKPVRGAARARRRRGMPRKD